MPKFLEDKLKAEYGNNPRAIYGTLNKIGAMRGNKETPKGRAMEVTHAAKVRSDSHPGLKYKHGNDGTSHPGLRYR